MAAVGRVAQHDHDGLVVLDLGGDTGFCLDVIFPNWLLLAFALLLFGLVKRVGQQDVQPVILIELATRFSQIETQTHVRQGVGRHQQLKAVQARQEATPYIVRPDTALTAHGFVNFLHDGQQEAACPRRRIQDVDVVAGQAVAAAKVAAQQHVHAAHDVADDRLRREVNATLLAHDRVVRGEEVFVEMHDGVTLTGFTAEIAHDLGDLRVGQARRQLLDGPLHLTLQVLENLPELAVQKAIGARHVGEGARQREIARGQMLQLHARGEEGVGQGLGVHVGEFVVVQFGQQFEFQIVLVLVQETAAVGRVERLTDQVGDFAGQVGHDFGQVFRRGDIGR